MQTRTSDRYTPGYTDSSVSFMARRSLKSHGGFFEPFLQIGASVLDCGCGPGNITSDIASAVFPGKVLGIDFSQPQVDLAMARFGAYPNLRFQQASTYCLPCADNSFERVFSNALIEHLSKPAMAVEEMFRVVKPGGYVGLCSPCWSGFVVTPPSEAIESAITGYISMQQENGGDPNAGGHLGAYLVAAGFEEIQLSARYECYEPVNLISDYLARQLDSVGHGKWSAAFRDWAKLPDAMFAQTWVSAIGRKPLPIESKECQAI